LLAWGSWQRHRASAAKAEFEAAKVQAHADYAKSERDAALLQAKRAKIITEAADAATIQAQADRVAADRARSAFERLQQRVSTAQAAGTAPAANATPGCPPASAAAAVPADVLGRLGQAAGQLAAIADDRRTAGVACERAFDAMTGR
jgi:hypothetical protein